MKIASIDGSSVLSSSETCCSAIDIDYLAEKVAALIQQKLELRPTQRELLLPSEIMLAESVSPDDQHEPRTIDMKLGICVYMKRKGTVELH
jgi:hypothetical protein